MEMEKINITLTNDQYELLLKGLRDAEASLNKMIGEIIIMGIKSPTLEKHALALFELRENIKQQGEQKDSVVNFKAKDWYVSEVDGKIHNMCHSVDKIEPKFKVGDWITNGLANPEQIISIEDDMYYSHSSIDNNIEMGGDIESIDKEYHLWTIHDAKDGDVLISRYNAPFIYKGHCNGLVDSYGGILNENEFHLADEACSWTVNENIHPATKEQRDTLFKTMADAGYEFDFEKKELKKIK